MSISKVIAIISWAIQKYEGIKSFVKIKYRAYRSRKIRSAVDNHDKSTIGSVVRSIIRKRQERRDSS